MRSPTEVMSHLRGCRHAGRPRSSPAPASPPASRRPPRSLARLRALAKVRPRLIAARILPTRLSGLPVRGSRCGADGGPDGAAGDADPPRPACRSALPVALVRDPDHLADNGLELVSQICGSLTIAFEMLIPKTASRLGMKSTATRASLVCSSMVRMRLQPPHWIRRFAR